MTIKTERAVNEAVTRLHASKLDKLKRWSRKALFATVSTIALAGGMLGTTQQMQAQNRENTTVSVNVNDLDAYLRANRGAIAQTGQQQYAGVYANRDNYRQQRQVNRQPEQVYYSADFVPPAQHSVPGRWEPLSLEESYYAVRGNFYDILTDDYMIESDGRGHFRAVEQFGDHNKIYLSAGELRQMYEHPGGDALGITHNPYGPDINNPENNPSWDRGYDYGPRRDSKVGRALHTVHTIYHIIRDHTR